jgi:adenine-specific DNA-methyltransferase
MRSESGSIGSIITNILTMHGTKEMRSLFPEDDRVFKYPKPSILIELLLEQTSSKDSIIRDFFSGCASTAQAVMQLNAKDGGNRKFILVQIPEKTAEDSEAYKAGYKNICEIGKERIRRAGMQIKEEVMKNGGASGLTHRHKFCETEKDDVIVESKLDIGFRVLKLDTSNMKPVFYNPADIEQNLLTQMEDNIKEDRTTEDLLFQVMLDMGIDLSSPIETKTIANKKVFSVGSNNLVACFDKDITKEVTTEIAKQKPLYAIFRDSSFASDDALVSFDQIFETFSPTTVRKVL